MMKSRMMCLILALLAVLCVMSPAGAADEAGNVFVSGNDPEELTAERDLYWAGGTRTFTGYSIGKSLLAAGRDITVSETEAGGSVRVAGYKARLSKVKAADNITVAAYDVNLHGVTASGVYLAGSKVYFNGTADCMRISAGNVFLNGDIAGDVFISGGKVQLAESLHVGGTLTVHTKEQVLIPVNAKIGNVVYDESNPPIPIKVTIGEYTADIPMAHRVRSLAFGMLGAVLAGALICLLPGGGELRKTAEEVLEWPVILWVTGFAGLIAVVLIFWMLLGSRFDLPDGNMTELLFSAALFYSPVFAGVTFANTWLPRVTQNRVLNNELVCSILGAAVFRLLRAIPVLGAILVVVTIIYTLGFFICAAFLRLRSVFSGS